MAKTSLGCKTLSVLVSAAMVVSLNPVSALAGTGESGEAVAAAVQAQENSTAGGGSLEIESGEAAPQAAENVEGTGAAENAETALVVANGTGYATLEEAFAAAEPDNDGVIKYEINGKAEVAAAGWVQVLKAGLTNAQKVEFVGNTSDAEICITQGVAVLADQGNDIDVSFDKLKLTKLNSTWAGDFGESTKYFTTWLRNTNAADNTVTYTNCTFPNGVCNNQYGTTVFKGCTFNNNAAGFYNLWVYGGKVQVEGGTFTGTRGVKAYMEDEDNVKPAIDLSISGASFTGLTEKAAVVVSKAANVSFDKVNVSDCGKGIIQKAIEGSTSDQEVAIAANGTGIGGDFAVSASTDPELAKSEFNISAGTFTSEVSSDYLAEGFEVSKNDDGTYGVKEAATAAVAAIGDATYPTLQVALDAAKNKTVTLLQDVNENVTATQYGTTLDLNGHTLNGGTVANKAALTITNKTYIKDSSEAQTGTIKREDTAENSGISSYYVIDIQPSASYVEFQSGNVENNSGTTTGTRKGASLVRLGDDTVNKTPSFTINGGNFKQDNFVAIKVDKGSLTVNGGTITSANDEAIKNWGTTNIKGGTVNGTVASWVYASSAKAGSTLNISDGTVNGDVLAMSYDGTADRCAKVSITGGAINGQLGTYQGKDIHEKTSLADATKATIGVTGGTFAVDPSAWLAESATISKEGDSYVVAKSYVAEVNGTSYYTIGEAWKAATSGDEPSEITVLRDFTLSDQLASGTANKVLNLNGKTLTYTGAGDGAFWVSDNNGSITVKNGSVISASGLLDFAPVGSQTWENASATFENVKATVNGYFGIQDNGNNSNDSLVMKNCELNVPNGFGIYFPTSGSVTLDNTIINAKTMGVQVCAGSLAISGDKTEINVTGDPVAKVENDGPIEDGAAISIVDRSGYKGLGTVTIEAGKFTAKSGNDALKAYAWDNASKTENPFDNTAKTIAVSGGSYSTAVSADYCAEGYIPVVNEDGAYGVADEASALVVAEVDGVKCLSLQAAINAATAGQTVKMVADATESIVVAAGKQLTLDLNGKTLTNEAGKSAVTNEGDLIVTDSTATAPSVNGSVVSGYSGGAIVAADRSAAVLTQNGGKFKLESGKLESKGNVALRVYGNRTADGAAVLSTVEVSGGYIIGPEGAVGVQCNGAIANIVGGVLEATDNAVVAGNGSTGNGGTTINISGGNLVGHIKSAGYIACGVYHPQNGQLNISGGSIYADGGVGVLARAGQVNITGGAIQTTGNAQGKVGDSTIVSNCFGVYLDGSSDYPAAKTGGLTAKISGGAVETESADVPALSLTNGKEVAADIKVTGGTYNTNVEDYAADGYVPTTSTDESGKVTYGVAVDTASGWMDVAPYRSGAEFTAPEAPAGQVFAGWYTDAKCTTPLGKDVTTGAAYPRFVEVSELIQFEGGSLRMDVGDPATSTYLRFGYTITVPANCRYVSNSWNYYKDPSNVKSLEAYNNLLKENGTAMSNLVITDVKTAWYEAPIYSQMSLTFKTADGTAVTAKEAQAQSRSVRQVAEMITKNPMAPDDQVAYAEKIVAACGNAE